MQIGGDLEIRILDNPDQTPAARSQRKHRCPDDLSFGERRFSREDLRILLAVDSKLALSLENALMFQTVERSATTDYMTNLPNARSLFMRLESELSRCKRTGVPLCPDGLRPGRI
jgi:GGDEF domain-containing protein